MTGLEVWEQVGGVAIGAAAMEKLEELLAVTHRVVLLFGHAWFSFRVLGSGCWVLGCRLASWYEATSLCGNGERISKGDEGIRRCLIHVGLD